MTSSKVIAIDNEYSTSTAHGEGFLSTTQRANSSRGRPERAIRNGISSSARGSSFAVDLFGETFQVRPLYGITKIRVNILRGWKEMCRHECG